MRTTTQPRELETAEIDVGELCANVVHGLQPIAQERGIVLNLEQSEARVLADREKIYQVMENLVGNALKFTEQGGSVEVAVETDSYEACLHVRDTGMGMDEEELARIFERYYRRHKTSGHNGLGLVISREVVRLHGGEIHVRSEPGRGSEFTVRLPRGADLTPS